MRRPGTASRPRFAALAAQTPARLAVGRTGPRLPWSARAPLVLGDAVARDAAYEEVARGLVARMKLTELGTRTTSRRDSLRDPGGACRLDSRARARLKRCRQRPDVQIIVCDGLAPAAVTSEARVLVTALTRLLRARRYRLGTPLFVRNGRTPVYREITRVLRPQTLCLLVGQRPTTTIPGALTAHVLSARSSAAAVTVRDICTGNVTPRTAARTLVDALDALLDTAPRTRRRRN